MSKKPSIVLLGLLAGAVCVPSSFAAANTLGYAGGINARGDSATHKAASTSATAAPSKNAAALKKRKLQQQQQAAQAAKAKKVKEAQALKAQQMQQQKKKWYEDDRDRGLDIASEYAPKTIARIRSKNYIARGDTVSTGNGKKGWQQYMDRYYSR